MRPSTLLLALALTFSLPSAASACSLAIEGTARHRNYDPLFQRAQPILLPYDSMCRSDPVPTEAEIRAFAAGASMPTERRNPAGVFARLAYLRGDTAGMLLAEPVLMASIQAQSAPGVPARRKCQPDADCEGARRHDLAGLHMAGAELHLQLFALTGERRWLDQAHAEANAAAALNVEGYENHGFGLTGQTIRSYVAIVDPERPLYPAHVCAVEGRRVCPMLYPVVGQDGGYGGSRSTATLAALYDPGTDPDAFATLRTNKTVVETLIPFMAWQARQATLAPDATAEGAREVLVPVRHLLSLLSNDEAHLRHALEIVEAQLLARIVAVEPESGEARVLRTGSRRKLRAIAALKDQPALAWRARRLLAAIDRRTYPADLFAF